MSAIAKKLELKFDVVCKQSELTNIFIVCDTFYMETCCQENGYVASVKLAQADKVVCL